MNNLIVACETLKDEVYKSLEITKCNFPVLWLDSKYHLDTTNLKLRLQYEINCHEGFDNILLVYGNCGNAVVGLEATTANLILPNTEDCISMILKKNNSAIRCFNNAYFLTGGWLESSIGLYSEFEYCCKKYGIKKTNYIFGEMLKMYNKLILIDNGTYCLDKYKAKAEMLSKLLNLELAVENGYIDIILKLFTGQWDDDFIKVKKGNSIKLEDFRIVTGNKANFFDDIGMYKNDQK
ncbi:hypothetical protein OXPF_42650 [Oxobacter pfennigii]|uniref:DUF1638 domain-containing protein n=1 Tax=Oxobacter pfennigii TaxID=36849 RepID=A0A0N8NSM9_9CLOT|nr:DUF1638 domain-containing protein [Oxobacter pfennigii]KPU42480.1 hypothetical protein OXPF_42650 [Oxobacter pfennigii]